MRAHLAGVLLLAALAGCKSEAEAPPTWHGETRAVVESKCSSCHVASGIGPFVLESYDDVATRSALVRQAVESEIMPPWPPREGCTDYEFDRSLTPKQHARFLQWIDGGMELGDPADYVAPEPPPGGLSRVDLALNMTTAFTPSISPDEYRCFLLDWPYPDDQYVTGFRARPGTASIVHHVIAFLIEPANAQDYANLDAQDATPGWECFGGPGGPGVPGFLGGWAPGTAGNDAPAGLGMLVRPGSKVVLQLHYNTSTAAAVPDVSGVDFKVDATVTRRAFLVPWLNPSWFTDGTMSIPAGNADVMHSFAFDPTPYLADLFDGMQSNQGFDIFGASLHMHTHGKSALIEIVRPGEDECMVDIPRWDFGWQGMYRFATPKRFEPGDQLRIECHFDNSTGTAPLNWGEGTGDEMCLGFLYVAQ